MRKHRFALGLVGGVVAASLAMTPAGVALAGADGADSPWPRAADLEGFAGYRTTSDDRDATVIITLPEDGTCDTLELTLARSFMGLVSESSYVSGIVGAFCQVGIPEAYMAGVETPEDGIVGLSPPPSAGDRIKVTIKDDGTSTTVTVKNLNTGGSISASAPSVPDNYEVGVQVAGPVHLVGGKLLFTKNMVDGAKLKASDPTKVIASDPEIPTYEPTKLKRGTRFEVRST